MIKKLSLSLILTSSILVSPAQAIEPISIAASVVGGSLFCKMISCKTIVNKTELIDLYKTRQHQHARFEDIRKNGLKLNFDEKFCRSVPDTKGAMCYENGKWSLK